MDLDGTAGGPRSGIPRVPRAPPPAGPLADRGARRRAPGNAAPRGPGLDRCGRLRARPEGAGRVPKPPFLLCSGDHDPRADGAGTDPGHDPGALHRDKHLRGPGRYRGVPAAGASLPERLLRRGGGLEGRRLWRAVARPAAALWALAVSYGALPLLAWLASPLLPPRTCAWACSLPPAGRPPTGSCTTSGTSRP